MNQNPGARLKADIRSYADAAAFLGRHGSGGYRRTRPLANNTIVQRIDDDTIVVVLHTTAIVTYYRDGRIKLDSGGWQTATTKDRMNKLLPVGYSLHQKKGQWWFAVSGKEREAARFFDGIILSPFGVQWGGLGFTVSKPEDTGMPGHSSSRYVGRDRPRTPTLGPCSCKPGMERDNCPQCEGTGQRIDFAAIKSQGHKPNPGQVVRIRRTPYGEWRVPGPDKTEAQAYYTTDKQDAIDTAVDMYRRVGIVDIDVQFGSGRPAYVARRVHQTNPKINMPVGSVGTVSEGTLATGDLLSAFGAELERIYKGHKMPAKVRKSIKDSEDVDEDSEEASEILRELEDALQEVAPPYTYFGPTEGDGADFGFWPSWDAINEGVYDEYILKVRDTSEVPKKYVGIVLHVNDHGNATMYSWTRGKGHELWSVV